MSQDTSRRDFIKQSSTAAAGITVASTLAATSYAKGSDEIRFALVGCGGRGTGAAAQIMNTSGNTRLVAVADAFEHKAKGSVNNLSKKYKDKVAVTDENTHVGLDAYKKAIDAGVDLVIIATPPGFKPQQFEYAVKQGKHIFCEKPVASDAPGVRRSTVVPGPGRLIAPPDAAHNREPPADAPSPVIRQPTSPPQTLAQREKTLTTQPPRGGSG